MTTGSKDSIRVKESEQDRICGVVMPISATESCSAEHWSEVLGIIHEAVETIEEPRFTVRLVSDALETSIIQKRIIESLYFNRIVVCDVSTKNPNVMFELGLRLAFDKPTVIIKDDKTDYSFDTAVIEHLIYPRDLRFQKIKAFKDKLSTKVSATHKKKENNPEQSFFLRNFGDFQVPRLDRHEIPAQEAMLHGLDDLRLAMSRLNQRLSMSNDRKYLGPRSGSMISWLIDLVNEWEEEQSALGLTHDPQKFESYLVRRLDAEDVPDEEKRRWFRTGLSMMRERQATRKDNLSTLLSDANHPKLKP